MALSGGEQQQAEVPSSTSAKADGAEAAAAPRIVVVPATDEHAPALAEFFHLAWGSEGSADAVLASRRTMAAENPVDPGTYPPTFLVMQGERIIGYCSSLPVRVWNGSAERGAYWAKGLMVLPEFRNGPIGFLVLKALTRALKIATSVTVASASKRLFGSLGYTDHGAMPNFILPLSLGRMLQQIDPSLLALGRLPSWTPQAVAFAQSTRLAWLGGSVAGLGFGAARALRSRTSLTLDGPVHVQAAELDDLWQRARGGMGAGPVRDAGALIPRYGDGRHEDYVLGTVRERGTLLGLAIVRRPRAEGDARLKGIRMASLSDFVFDPSRTDVGIATLRVAAQLGRAVGGDAMLASASHQAVIDLLRSQLFLPIAGNIHFFLRDKSDAPVWPAALGEWWLTRGDGYSDETF